jgi:hypothetical protein
MNLFVFRESLLKPVRRMIAESGRQSRGLIEHIDDGLISGRVPEILNSKSQDKHLQSLYKAFSVQLILR